MQTQKSVLDAELESLLAQLAKTPEHAALDEFLLSHPDVEIPYPFINLFKSAYTRHVHSVRLRKIKEARQGGSQALALLKPAEISRIAEASQLVRRAKQGEPNAAFDLAMTIIQSNWDMIGRTDRFTPEQDKDFLTDVTNYLYGEITDAHRVKLGIIGQDFVKWLAKQQFAVRH